MSYTLSVDVMTLSPSHSITCDVAVDVSAAVNCDSDSSMYARCACDVYVAVSIVSVSSVATLTRVITCHPSAGHVCVHVMLNTCTSHVMLSYTCCGMAARCMMLSITRTPTAAVLLCASIHMTSSCCMPHVMVSYVHSMDRCDNACCCGFMRGNICSTVYVDVSMLMSDVDVYVDVAGVTVAMSCDTATAYITPAVMHTSTILIHAIVHANERSGARCDADVAVDADVDVDVGVSSGVDEMRTVRWEGRMFCMMGVWGCCCVLLLFLVSRTWYVCAASST